MIIIFLKTHIKNTVSVSRLSQVGAWTEQTDRQTDRQMRPNPLPRRIGRWQTFYWRYKNPQKSRRFAWGARSLRSKRISLVCFVEWSKQVVISEWYTKVGCSRDNARRPSYNFAAGSFHTTKLRSRLYSVEIEFYSEKLKNRFLSHPFGD